MSAYRKDFHETKYTSFLIKDGGLFFEKKLKIVSKKSLIVNQHKMENV